MVLKYISTHILTKRMTGLIDEIGVAQKISTHILTKRMTYYVIHFQKNWDISTHILTKRMTCARCVASSIPLIFQLTSSRRG